MERKKQRMDQRVWEEALARVQTSPPADLPARIDLAGQRIRAYRARYPRLAFAHSGGKDSMVLADLAMRQGVDIGVWVRCNLEFPSFVAFMQELARTVPLRTVNTGQDLAWLWRNQHMLFPKESRTSALWFSKIQHAGQRRFFTDRGLDALLLGRRWSDGNYCGKGDAMEYVDGHGTRRISPIADWGHDHILAYMHIFDLPWAPCYQWPRGFRTGTGPWAKRRVSSNDQGWTETAAIDRSVVTGAAQWFSGAKEWCEKNPA